MPVYDYECRDCKTVKEHFITASDRDKIKTCSRCGGELFRICGNNGGFRLKDGGVGWAKDGYSRRD